MSDDRTNDPSPYGHTPDSNGTADASRPTNDGVPPAPAYDAPSVSGTGSSPSGQAVPPAPAYGAPTYPAPTYDASASGAPAGASAQPYGQQNYGQPYGQQGYNAPAYGYGSLPRVNPLAIVALVSSLVGIFAIPFIGQIVGIITGHISLKQIKTTGERGRGMALAGLLVGYISIGLVILLVVIVGIIAVSAGASGARYGA